MFLISSSSGKGRRSQVFPNHNEETKRNCKISNGFDTGFSEFTRACEKLQPKEPSYLRSTTTPPNESKSEPIPTSPTEIPQSRINRIINVAKVMLGKTTEVIIHIPNEVKSWAREN